MEEEEEEEESSDDEENNQPYQGRTGIESTSSRIQLGQSIKRQWNNPKAVQFLSSLTIRT